MLRRVTKDQSSDDRKLQSVLATEAVNCKLRSRDSDKNISDDEEKDAVSSRMPVVAQLSPPEQTFDSQFSSSKSEWNESEYATENNSNLNTPDASDDYSEHVCLDDLETLSLEEEEDQYNWVQRWDGTEQKEQQQHVAAKMNIFSAEEENHLGQIVYPAQQHGNVKHGEEVTAKINTFSDVQEKSVSAKSRPTSTLKRSQSVRVPKHTRSSLFPLFREPMDLGPSRHKAAEGIPHGNTRSDNDDNLVLKTSTKVADRIHVYESSEKPSYVHTKDIKTIQRSQLEGNTDENVVKANRFDIYRTTGEHGNGFLQRTKTNTRNLDLITEELSNKNEQTKLAESQNQACESGEDMNVSLKPRTAEITNESRYSSHFDDRALFRFGERGSHYQSDGQQQNETLSSHAYAPKRRELTQRKPANVHTLIKENITTSRNTKAPTKSQPANVYSQPYQGMPPSSRNAGNVTPQPRGLQRTLSMRENKTSRAPERFTPKVTQYSPVFVPLAFSARPKLSTKLTIKKKGTVQKAASPFSLDSDVLINSGNSVDIYRREAPAQASFSRKKINRSQETKMEVPTNNVGVWKFGEENFFTSVPKVWTVSDCIAHVQNTIGRHGYGVLDLWIKNRCIMLDKTKSLSDYPGLKSLHVVRRPTSRDPHPLHQTSRVDDTDPYCEDTCVGMCCGHAISPDNLYNYVWQKIKNGATEVTCPAIPDATKPGEQCSNVWEFKSISMLACLSDDENYLFCDKLFSNWLEKEADVYICPTCNEAIHSSCVSVFKCFYCEQGGKSHSFCVKCNRAANGNSCFNNECQESLPKVKALLKDCRMRTIIGVPNCPSVRACPVCQCVIEYEEEDLCKHMTCPKNTCKAQFCFICLKVKTDKYYYPCGGAFEPCQPTPRQII